MKKVLIVGANSYIGMAVENWLNAAGEYEVSVADLITTKPEDINFENIDVVFDVTGIAHVKETDDKYRKAAGKPLDDELAHRL